MQTDNQLNQSYENHKKPTNIITKMNKKYNEAAWTNTLKNNIKTNHYLHTHNPNYISKPPIQLYQTQSKSYYNPKQSIDRDVVWKSSSHKVNLNKSLEHIFRSTSKSVEQYHKRNSSGNIINHQFTSREQNKKILKTHPAVEKRKQIRTGTHLKDDSMSITSTTSSAQITQKSNYMNSKLMKQTLQYQYGSNKPKQSYMPKSLHGK